MIAWCKLGAFRLQVARHEANAIQKIDPYRGGNNHPGRFAGLWIHQGPIGYELAPGGFNRHSAGANASRDAVGMGPSDGPELH